MVKSTDALMSRLRELNVKLWLDGDQLGCRAPKGVMSAELAAELSARKADILRYLQQAESSTAASHQSRIAAIPRHQPLPLSFGQQRLWFLEQLEGPSPTYNMPLAMRLEGSLDVLALEKALNEIMRRHEVLRSNFTLADEQAVIRIRETAACPLTVVEAKEAGAEQQRWIHQEARRCFDLANDPLVHATLVQWSDRSQLFLLTMHHIVSDGWSLGIFLRELVALYEAFSKGFPSPLPELSIQYLDYAHWQRQRLQGVILDRLLDYWRRQLSGAPELLALPTDRPRPPIQSYRGHSLNARLDADLSTRLQALSQTAGTTLFMTLLSGFALLLSRYSGQEDIVIGTPVANRNHADIEALIGLFINTLALRLDLSANPSVQELLARVRSTCLAAYEHQNLPFEQLVEALKPPRSLSYAPLFQVSFDLQNTSQDAIAMPGLSLYPVEQEAVAAKFDLSLSVEATATELLTVWNYNADLFDEASIIRMNGHYRTLLESMVAKPTQALSELALLDEHERRHILFATNATARSYPTVQSFLELFETQAQATPDRIALSCGYQSLSYRQLAQRVSKLASALQMLGVGAEALVALCLERSLDMVIGLLAIMRAGGAYIPLDPGYPPERLAAVLDDARPLLLLTQQALEASLPASGARVICLDRDREMLTDLARQNPHSPVLPAGSNTAYVIFTSGSTGRPKGVQIQHGSLLNFLMSMQREPGLSEQDSLLAVTTIAFDIAALEIYLPLISGAHLLLADRETALDGRQLQATLQCHGISHMQATPATWRLLLESDWKAPKPFNVLCGGEALPVALARQLLENGLRLWNLYGPTETTIWSSVREVLALRPDQEAVEPIGHPIQNTQIHILDKTHQPLPIGIVGELHIGGDGLARGYLNRPSLTADSYRPDAFTGKAGARLYRSGDLARRLPDGGFAFLGRQDHQVKIRGYRIELGDIEAALRQLPGVKHATVLAREDVPGDKRLVAYLLASPETALGINELRSHLKHSLPDYMLPAAFVFIAELPLTPNGKINRKALPAPDSVRPELTAGFAAPRNALENSIAEIWRQTLNLEHVGIDDNFFDLGGHSLLLTRVYESLRKQVSEPFALITLFQHPTIRSLASRLADQEAPSPLRIRATPSRRPDGNDDIAIIGLTGRFPGADDLQQFWNNLREGRESISFFSREELLESGIEAELIDLPHYVRANGILSDVAGFDAAFFGYTPAEAEIIDPQQRLFLENAWHTLEHAGYGTHSADTAIGVFAGCSHNGYLIRNLLPHLYSSDAHSIYQVILGSDKDFLSTRVSYALDLRGPSVSVQTACSTSLVAIHLACRSLLDSECDMALAGGVGLKIPQKSGYVHEQGMINSADGHCRAFDASADGTTWGSGLGIVLLKPLASALADRDAIHAVIKASAINNDGALKIGYTAPGVEGQAQVIANAQARANVAPDSISYIETHGTGTHLGDQIEIAALSQAFRSGTDNKQFCALGAVKTNIGHLDAAAGVAGLCKTVLALQHRQIPPTLHFERPNPEIDFEHSPFYVNDRLRDWPANGAPRRAGVSSFGIGGTNAHLIVEEAPPATSSASSRPWQLLILSARSLGAVENQRLELFHYLQEHPDINLADAAYTLGLGRRQFSQRIAVVCRDRQDAIIALQTTERCRSGHIAKNRTEAPGVAFLFPGQGSQYVAMGADLYRDEAVFRKHIDDCAERLLPELGLDLRQILYPSANETDQAPARLEQTWLTQPALFVTEYALAQLLMSWGIAPGAMIGHSLGEYVAACLAGVFDLETALMLVARRGRLIWEQPQGAMLAVSLPVDKTQALLGDQLSLAAINAAEACVVSGPFPAIAALKSRLENQAIACRQLQTSHAFHSSMMEAAITAFAEILSSVSLNPPRLPFISNLTGTWISPQQAVDPGYWAKHLRLTVNFEAGIATLLTDPDRLLLEVGPGAILSRLVRRHPLAGRHRCVLTSLAGPGSTETPPLLDSLGRLWCVGVDVDWAAFYAHEPRSRIPLPVYPFERQRYWIDPPAADVLPSTAQNPLKKPPLEEWFYLPGWKPTLTPRPLCDEDFAEQSLWLVFSDESGFSRLCIAKLQQAGQAVITVCQGDSYSQHGGDYRINPASADDYGRLIQSLEEKTFHKILHFWSLSAADVTGPEIFEQSQLNGYYSLLFLGRALAKQQHNEKIDITVISNHLHDVNGQGEIVPEKATLLGPCLVMPQEIPRLSCRCLDVSLASSSESGTADLLNRVLAEIAHDGNDPLLAYRGSRRLVPGFERVALGADGDSVRQLRRHGVYLITGGLGNIGLLLAKFLAETVQARLVLLGRSFFPTRSQWPEWLQNHPADDELSLKIQAIQTLENLGAEVVLLQADVADEKAMQLALAQVHSQFGALHGLIHAAGRLNDPSFVSALTDTGRRESQAQFGPKIHGLYVLEKLLRERQLDFCLLISSTSAVLGGLGFTAYSAANLFLDAFAARQNRVSTTPWLSTDWDAWQFTDTPQAEALSMQATESVEAFRRLISQVFSGRIIIATGDLEKRFKQWVRRENGLATPPANKLYTRPELSSSYSAPNSHSENQLTALWQNLLGFAEIGIDDDFFELGGDSMLAIRLLSGIKEKFARQLPLTVLLDKPSIRQLAQTLDQPEESRTFSPLVAIQSQGSLPAFFCVPGTGGNVLYFNELARCFAEYDRPFYALQAQGLDGLTPPLTRIEDIAALNVRALQKVQAQGPYYLGGHSFGSWVAFEMARQLQKAGHEVALLAILDTGSPAARDLSAIGGWDDSRWLVAVANTLGHLYEKPLSLNYEKIVDLTWSDQIELLAQCLAAQGITQPGTDAAEIRGFVEVYKTQARIDYRPIPDQPVKIALFRAREPLADFLDGMPEHLKNDASWGWQQYSKGAPILEYTPGDHLTMVTQPHVRRLTQLLHLALSLAQGNFND
ncbi:non-ribosomal peptide synthetase/type I polyketide synthase [Methylomonas albis]|uniref:Amino acid adenylation domain-containing protein n=1 Tax=Methylomonas albis TaxID=1854563 RepID=A0ABR9D4J2_9GAMM|nr:non-ribosomal peptide synthetase/type I polyketide synthase [Methylomonas albis]MBD9358039.1 amino acid adenylation domain-containing protein [Methylomonas albis]